MKTIIGMAVVAALGVVTLSTTAQYASAQAAAAAPAAQAPAAKKQKQVKDTGEYDIYNDVIKDAQTLQANPANAAAAKKFLTDLDSWTQKYPDTEFKDVRTMYYLQAQLANRDASKAFEVAKTLIDKGLDGLKDGLDNPAFVLSTLFQISNAAAVQAGGGTATPDQMATGAKAAQMLSEFGKTYFAKENKPASLTDQAWADGLKQVEDQAKGTIFQIALAPGLAIVKSNPKDPATCANAEAAFRKLVGDYPKSGAIAKQVGDEALCQQSTNPAKAQQALYMYARAVGLPVGELGGLDADSQKKLDDYLKKAYTGFHGSEEGLPELKALAANNPLPPDDFKIKTSTQISMEKEEEFKTKNPQLAVWMGIKGQLADTNGQTYFESGMKGSMMAGENGAKFLKGKLLEAKPACRPKELLVAVPLPGAQPVAEITIKLVDDQMKPLALTGKPDVGGDIQFNGAPSAFVKEPFMLTLDAQKTDIEGLTMTPCTAAPVAPKKAPAAPPKKK